MTESGPTGPGTQLSSAKFLILIVLAFAAGFLTKCVFSTFDYFGEAAYAFVPSERLVVLFDKDDGQISESDIPTLEQVARVMHSNPACSVLIVGGHDNLQDDHNESLAIERAFKAALFLKSRGVSEERIKERIISPPAKNVNEPLKRNAVFHFVGKGCGRPSY